MVTLTKEEINFLIQLLDKASITGINTMNIALGIANKLIEEQNKPVKIETVPTKE